MVGESVFLSHPSSLDHDPGPHPEQAARITVILRELAAHDWFGCRRLESPPAEREVLEAVHPPAYVAGLERLCAAGGGAIDADTSVSEGSFTAARHGSGGAVRLAELLAGGEALSGLSAHRPPGHHATATRPMGFCLLNHVAVAARHALDRLGLKRVMVLDWDVHHGNGTEAIFRSSNEVLFASIHQTPLYPGTGSVSEVGAGAGEGFTVNLPVPAGSGDSEWVSLVQHVVVPLARLYAPQLVLISAGFDAHQGDPLADCLLTEEGFAAMASLVSELGVPVGAILEGGYALDALARSVAATLRVLAADPGRQERVDVPVSELAAAARARLGRWWEL